MIKWTDQAEDFKETFPEGSEESFVEGINWRSDCLCWRITAVTNDVPEASRTWNLWDMRGAEKPWGPREVGQKKGFPILIAGPFDNIKNAIVAAEIYKGIPYARKLILGYQSLKKLKRELRELSHREDSFRGELE